MDYELYYNYPDSTSIIGIAMIMIAITLAIAVLFGIFMIVVLWKIYKKAGKAGWTSLVPFYNQYVLSEITWGNGWYFLLSFATIIPYIGVFITIAFAILSYIKLAKAFDKSDGFAIGLIFLNPIFLAILAFDKSQYIGIPNNNQDNTAFTNNNTNNTSNKFCTNCGNKLADNSLFCSKCGMKIE